MASKAIGQANCPECGHTETVMNDGRKSYIKCSAPDCRTFTNYQAKTSKERIQKRLTAIPEPEPAPPVDPAHVPVFGGTPTAEKAELSQSQIEAQKSDPKPAKAPGFLESLDNLF